MNRIAFAFAALAIRSIAHAADPSVVSDAGNWQDHSPDGKYLATLSVQPDKDQNRRKDIGTGLLEVVTAGKTPQSGDHVRFSLGDRCGWRAQWSPDSRYLVMTTASLGGHSPWHAEAYVYCVNDRTLREMDDVIQPVVSSTFRFVGAHTVQMGVGIPSPEGYDPDHAKQVDVDLSEKSPAMKKQSILRSGHRDGM